MEMQLLWISHHLKRLEKQKKYHLSIHLEKRLSNPEKYFRIIFYENKLGWILPLTWKSVFLRS